MAATAVTEDLWQAHCGRGDRAAREAIILKYAPLVKYVAGRLSIALPPVLDMDDVLSSGMVGLIRAVEHYDPGRGVPFENYAVTCIRGAILDQLRSLDVFSRSVRQRAREIEKAMTSLQMALGRLPTDDEVADKLGLSVDSYRKLLTEVGPATISLDAMLVGDGDGEAGSLLSTLEDTNSPDPVSLAERRGLLDSLAEAISNLSERERLLLALYYKEELTMREISRVMGVSESRVCQLHTRAVLRLRAQMQSWRRTEE
ncbi:MAG: FliA/WhiG family RNA polymerase sigma factor [Sphingomonadaceae bacterium]